MKINITSSELILMSRIGKTTNVSGEDILRIYETGDNKVYITTSTGVIRISVSDIEEYNGGEPPTTSKIIADISAIMPIEA